MVIRQDIQHVMITGIITIIPIIDAITATIALLDVRKPIHRIIVPIAAIAVVQTITAEVIIHHLHARAHRMQHAVRIIQVRAIQDHQIHQVHRQVAIIRPEIEEVHRLHLTVVRRIGHHHLQVQHHRRDALHHLIATDVHQAVHRVVHHQVIRPGQIRVHQAVHQVHVQVHQAMADEDVNQGCKKVITFY